MNALVRFTIIIGIKIISGGIGKNELSEKVKQAKKPIIIIGQSVLKLKSSLYIFEELKKFLVLNNKINAFLIDLRRLFQIYS